MIKIYVIKVGEGYLIKTIQDSIILTKVITKAKRFFSKIEAVEFGNSINYMLFTIEEYEN